MKLRVLLVMAALSVFIFSLPARGQTQGGKTHDIPPSARDTTDVTLPDDKQQEREAESAASLYGGKELFAISTNLLMDAVTAVNLGVHVPFGRRWMVSADYTFPWWVNNAGTRALKVRHLNIGARYYFKPWTSRGSDVCLGWYTTASFGSGNYNFAWDGNTARATETLPAIGGGYSLPLGDWWRLDFSANIGLLISHTADVTSILPDPTGLKVSIVYHFHTPVKR